MKKNSPQFSEKLTRKELIDGELTDAGWRIISERDFDASRPLRTYDRCAIGEYPTDRGPADYALCADGKVLAVVEAKKLTLGPQNVLSQAERYAMGLSWMPSFSRSVGGMTNCTPRDSRSS